MAKDRFIDFTADPDDFEPSDSNINFNSNISDGDTWQDPILFDGRILNYQLVTELVESEGDILIDWGYVLYDVTISGDTEYQSGIFWMILGDINNIRLLVLSDDEVAGIGFYSRSMRMYAGYPLVAKITAVRTARFSPNINPESVLVTYDMRFYKISNEAFELMPRSFIATAVFDVYMYVSLTSLIDEVEGHRPVYGRLTFTWPAEGIESSLSDGDGDDAILYYDYISNCPEYANLFAAGIEAMVGWVSIAWDSAIEITDTSLDGLYFTRYLSIFGEVLAEMNEVWFMEECERYTEGEILPGDTGEEGEGTTEDVGV